MLFRSIRLCLLPSQVICRLLQEGRKVLWHWEESPGQPFFWLFDDGTVKGITGDQAAAVSILDRETIQLL